MRLQDTHTPHTTKTILVTDDEPYVLNVVAAILEHFGYFVLRAAGADEALRLAAHYGGPIALLLTDVVMPQTSGPELASRFANLHPETRVLYMAGYPDHPLVRTCVLGAGHEMLVKPFLPRTLVNKVNQVLGEGMRAQAVSNT